MTESEAKIMARHAAMTRSTIYAVVRQGSGRDNFDAYPRFYDDRGRTDKGDVWASYNPDGSRRDI